MQAIALVAIPAIPLQYDYRYIRCIYVFARQAIPISYLFDTIFCSTTNCRITPQSKSLAHVLYYTVFFIEEAFADADPCLLIQ